MTLKYYQDNAQIFFDGTVNVDMSSLYEAFTQHLAPGARVLDAGCGSGRDAKAFLKMGYQVEAFDASPAMVELARVHTGLPVKEEFDGIWCCASLLHVPAVELPGVMRRLADALKPGGVWYVSFKYGEGEREVDGRRFTDMDEVRLQGTLKALAFINIESVWKTRDKRPGREEVWLNGVLQKK